MKDLLSGLSSIGFDVFSYTVFADMDRGVLWGILGYFGVFWLFSEMSLYKCLFCPYVCKYI